MAAQIFSKLSSMGMATSVFGEEMGSILDNVFVLCKTYTQNKKEAERIVKKTIKISMKLDGLFKKAGNDYLIDLSFEFEGIFLEFASKVICFYEDDTIYNQECLIKLLNGCKDLLKKMFLPHLKETSKSLRRIDLVFGFVTNPAFLDAIFTHPDYKETMDAMISTMRNVI